MLTTCVVDQGSGVTVSVAFLFFWCMCGGRRRGLVQGFRLASEGTKGPSGLILKGVVRFLLERSERRIHVEPNFARDAWCEPLLVDRVGAGIFGNNV